MNAGGIAILSFALDDPLLDTRDPREPVYGGQVSRKSNRFIFGIKHDDLVLEVR